jgi:hypothetical protein
LGSGNPSAVDAATAATSDSIQVIMRRNTANDKSPLPERPYEKSGVVSVNTLIKPSCTIKIGKSTAALAKNQVTLVGSTTAASAINLEGETLFEIRTGAKSERIDQHFSQYNVDTVVAQYTTPDWTLDTVLQALTAPDQITYKRDWLVKNLVAKYNYASDGYTVAMALSSTSAAGTAISTIGAASGATIGTTIVIGYKDDGTAITLYITKDIWASFNAMLGTYGAYRLVPVAMDTTANSVLSATFKPGSVTAAVDFMMVLALNEKDAFYDESFRTKVDFKLGLSAGFNTVVATATAVIGSEGMETGRRLSAAYHYEQDYYKYPSPHRYQALSTIYPDNILQDAYYDLITIEHSENHQNNQGMIAHNPRQLQIAVVNTVVGGNTTVNPYFNTAVGTPVNPQLQAMLGYANLAALPVVGTTTNNALAGTIGSFFNAKGVTPVIYCI